MPLKRAFAVRETVAGQRLGTLEGGLPPPPPPSKPSLDGPCFVPLQVRVCHTNAELQGLAVPDVVRLDVLLVAHSSMRQEFRNGCRWTAGGEQKALDQVSGMDLPPSHLLGGGGGGKGPASQGRGFCFGGKHLH